MAKNLHIYQTLQENHSRPFSNFNSIYQDLATAVASRRFFFSSPGRSNSIVDSSTSTSNPDSDAISGGSSVAVLTYSPDPFADFRRSMQEMVEAREVHDVCESWDYLHELLMCYLSLNQKSTHKFIVGAFSDLLVSLVTEKGRREMAFSGGKCEILRR
ncbi:hypothetical protein CASFOL_008833 [Castilleja foliolosa]|uniref:Transcription repressor n=1 Tax=Castilleja foliolosa TaxID=1961234 RepID=A0ABD3E041_9LAMI